MYPGIFVDLSTSPKAAAPFFFLAIVSKRNSGDTKPFLDLPQIWSLLEVLDSFWLYKWKFFFGLSQCSPSTFGTPWEDFSILQNRGEGEVGGMKLLDVPQLSLDGSTITSIFFISPRNYTSIMSQSSEGLTGSFNFLHILQLVSHLATVAATKMMTPCHHRRISKDCSKCTEMRGINLLHIFQFIFHRFDVTTTIRLTPGNLSLHLKRSSRSVKKAVSQKSSKTRQLEQTKKKKPLKKCTAQSKIDSFSKTTQASPKPYKQYPKHPQKIPL